MFAWIITIFVRLRALFTNSFNTVELVYHLIPNFDEHFGLGVLCDKWHLKGRVLPGEYIYDMRNILIGIEIRL